MECAELTYSLKVSYTHNFISVLALFLPLVLKGGKKGEMIMQTFKRQYLRHPEGRVVWAQVSAYQDTSGLAMWCDLVLKPARVLSGSARWALIWDNVKCHAVDSVRKVFEDAGIVIFDLPVYMTDLLQPVDIVPNGPLKAHTRRARIDKLYTYFGDWRSLAEDAQKEGVSLPPFRPPASTMAAGLSLISRIFKTRFTEDDYMAGVRRCFVSVGLAPGSDGTYIVYTSHERARTRAKAFRATESKVEVNGSALFDDFIVDSAGDHATPVRNASASELPEQPNAIDADDYPRAESDSVAESD